MGDVNVTYSTEMISLYEYLGRAAGSELGKSVYKAAYLEKIPVETQEISNPKYTGKVLRYPKNFLDNYFKISK
jgi:hypothetical protein